MSTVTKMPSSHSRAIAGHAAVRAGDFTTGNLLLRGSLYIRHRAGVRNAESCKRFGAVFLAVESVAFTLTFAFKRFVHAFNGFRSALLSKMGLPCVLNLKLDEHITKLVVPDVIDPGHAILAVTSPAKMDLPAVDPDLKPFLKGQAHFDSVAESVQSWVLLKTSKSSCERAELSFDIQHDVLGWIDMTNCTPPSHCAIPTLRTS